MRINNTYSSGQKELEIWQSKYFRIFVVVNQIGDETIKDYQMITKTRVTEIFLYYR